jgi:hypothetical protein
MSNAPGPSDPDVRPPFWRHRYYYLALKIIVLGGVVIALRLLGYFLAMSKERLYLFDNIA